MRRGTIVVIVFIVVAVAIVGASRFLRAQPPLELTLAVSPLAERWVRAAVESFNASNPLVNSTRRVHWNVTVIDDMGVWQDERRANWTPENHPVAWIPASSVSIRYAADSRLPFEIITPSLARTPLVWGGYESRVNVVTQGDTLPLDCQSVQVAAAAEAWSALAEGQASWGFVKLAFDQPSQAIPGLGVLYACAASFAGSADLSSGDVLTSREFRDWFAPVANSVPNFNTLGADPAAAMASRGASVGEIALLPESRWLTNLDGLLRNETARFSYPAYQFAFDFPLARWQDATTGDEQRQAVDILGAWLLNPARQADAADYGLRPVSGELTETDALFARAEAYGIRLAPDLGQPVAAPSRTQAQRLLQWFNGL